MNSLTETAPFPSFRDRFDQTRFFVRLCFAAVTCWTSSLLAQEAPPALPQVAPTIVGIQSNQLSKIESIVKIGIDQNQLPGAVVCFGRGGKIAYLKAFGNRMVGPESEAMTTDTVFDLASLTKPIATATSVMKLIQDGKIGLGEKVTRFLPEFAPNGKDAITIQDLLLHQTGLTPDNALADYLQGADLAWKRICELNLREPVRTKFRYSDVNFIVLGKLVETVSGRNLQQFSKEEIFGPLQMRETGFNPASELRARSAPTQKRDGRWMRGEVHDPRAFHLGGIAGHAGLFSTANDLALFAQMFLGGGKKNTRSQTAKVLSPLTIEKMISPHTVSSGIRGLGWDIRTAYSSNRGDLLSPRAFGHGGFTGTVLWIDPNHNLFFIFLSNRVHPDGHGSVNALAGRILNIVASSIDE